MMLVWLMTIEVCVRPLKSFGSSSRPIRNMKRTRPTWLSILRTGSESAGKSPAIPAGHNQPSSDGPRTMPAITSAMTSGWPSHRVTTPRARETRRIAAICTSATVRSLNSRWGNRGVLP